jgi:alkanesulfonate monooxygenase SsuD/methylene tetrahydromethanopterin reductase-like flavin-dependent oxidoreductase (luciferase family)
MIGGGEKRTLRLVAQYADMCNVSGGPATIAHKLDVLRTHCKDVGRDPSEITTTRLGTLMLTNNAAETEGTTEFIRGLAGAELHEQFIIGEPDDVVRRWHPHRRGLDC